MKPKGYMHQSELRTLVGKAVQLAAADGYRYRDGKSGDIRRLVPFLSGHKRTLFARAEVEAFVSDLYAGKLEFIKKLEKDT